MNRRIALLFVLALAACKRPPAVDPDASIAPPAPTDLTASVADAAPPPSGPADAGPVDERKRVLAGLLSGDFRASDLPESSTDPGRGFDRGLRKRLTEVEVAPGPRAEVRLEAATPSAPIDDLDRVVAGLRPRFRQCYQSALDGTPAAARGGGKVVVTFVVDDKGEVASSNVTSNAGLPEITATCVAGVVRRAQFSAPKRSAKVMLPLTFSTATPE